MVKEEIVTTKYIRCDRCGVGLAQEGQNSRFQVLLDDTPIDHFLLVTIEQHDNRPTSSDRDERREADLCAACTRFALDIAMRQATNPVIKK